MRWHVLLAITLTITGCGEGSGGGSSEIADGTGDVADQPAGPIDPNFGARAPRTCADKSAPAKGPITAGLARKYFICKAEKYVGADLYLVENVKLQVGGGVPYTPNLGAFHEIDVTVPLYPIRGSLVKYSCAKIIGSYSPSPESSCQAFDEPAARGYCYKTTFNDWDCYMSDTSQYSQSRRGPPPRSL